jgi:hypothetical protein
MTTKEIALKTIHDLPENATWKEIQERINIKAEMQVVEIVRVRHSARGIPQL